jgi:hypothetical protein
MPASLARRLGLLAGLAALALGLAPAASAQARLKLALEIHPGRSLKGATASADSVTRRVVTQLVPLFEADGYDVVRVEDVSQAATSGRYHLAARVSVDARPVHHVRSAREYEGKGVDHVEVDYSESVEVWGRWEAWDAMTGKKLDGNRFEPIMARLMGGGSGSAELDDEESVARLLAQQAHDTLTAALAPAHALR